MNDAELQAQYVASITRHGAPPRPGCPPPEQLQALAERTGTEESRLEVLDHVMSCPACHRELALFQSIHAAQPRQATLAPRHWLAAAGLLILLGGGALFSRVLVSRTGDDLMRDATPELGRDRGVTVVMPQGTAPAGGPRTLAWHPVPRVMRYSVEVLDMSDRVLYARQTTDTSLALPPLPAAPAAWWVRATLDDGSERRSPIVKVR
jgi:hypothetical protein